MSGIRFCGSPRRRKKEDPREEGRTVSMREQSREEGHSQQKGAGEGSQEKFGRRDQSTEVGGS